jgi:hypothetical protein
MCRRAGSLQSWRREACLSPGRGWFGNDRTIARLLQGQTYVRIQQRLIRLCTFQEYAQIGFPARTKRAR